jgi:hypothetical protein
MIDWKPPTIAPLIDCTLCPIALRLGGGNTSVGTLAARVLDPLPSLLECVAHVRRLNEFGSVAHGSAVPHLVQLVYQPGAVLGKAAHAMARKFKPSPGTGAIGTEIDTGTHQEQRHDARGLRSP